MNAKTNAAVLSTTTRADGTPLPPGKVLMQGWMNVYRAGWFHRENKPNGFDRHSGDFYETKELAMADVEPASHYIDTVSFVWEDFEVVKTNPADAVPIPLATSRKAFKAAQEALTA